MKVPPAALLQFVFNWLWPPFWATGITIKAFHADYRYAKVMMRLRFYNKNYVGVHFGGNLYAMTDPFYMMMLLKNLGSGYYVWDQSGSIEYLAPGRGDVTAEFQLSEQRLREIKQQAADGKKVLPSFSIVIKDADGTSVAKVVKTLYVKKKPTDSKGGS